MTPRTWLLLSWILVGAAVLVAHVVVLRRALGAKEVSATWRWLSLVPPVAPVVAWIGGGRVAPIVWGGLVVAYVVLRVLEGRI